VLTAQLELKDHKVFREQQELMVPLVRKDHKVYKESLGRRGHKAFMG
jgi:hypothetical protein